MDKSKFLSKALGIYFIIISLAMFLNMHQFAASVQSLVNNSSLMFVTGFFTLILGILMVVSHNIWELSWRVVITIIAWLTLVKGASIILYPQFIDQGSALFVQNMNFAYVAAGLDFILGVVLSYFGFKR